MTTEEEAKYWRALANKMYAQAMDMLEMVDELDKRAHDLENS